MTKQVSFTGSYRWFIHFNDVFITAEKKSNFHIVYDGRQYNVTADKVGSDAGVAGLTPGPL